MAISRTSPGLYAFHVGEPLDFQDHPLWTLSWADAVNPTWKAVVVFSPFPPTSSPLGHLAALGLLLHSHRG